MIVLSIQAGGALANCFVPSTPNDGYFDQTWGGTGLGCVLFDGDNTDSTATSVVKKMVPTSDGGLILGGDAAGPKGSDYWWLGKLDASGNADSTFGDSDLSGRITECALKTCGSFGFSDFALQTDGKVSVSNSTYLTRTTANAHALDTAGVAGGTGSVNSYFTIGTPGGTLHAGDYNGSAIAVAPGGKTFAAGYGSPPGAASFDFGIARLNSDLAVDTSFHAAAGSGITYAGGNFVELVSSVLGARPGEASQIFTMSDGRIVLASSNGYHDILIARLTSAGILDTTFNSNGTQVVTSFPAGLAYTASYSGGPALVDRAGRVVFLTIASKDGLYGPLVTRFKADGTQDTSFPDQGYGAGWLFYNTFTACPNGGFQLSVVRPLAIDSAGRILIFGTCDSAFGVIRLRGDTGALDTSWGVSGMAHGHFDPTSTTEEAGAITFDGAGHLFISGATHPSGVPQKAVVARLTYDLIYTNNFEDKPAGCLPPNCN
jgi:uncharacterized delta-60 repeat protein